MQLSTRPAFAFLANITAADQEEERKELLEIYNVDVIPYKMQNLSHEQLIGLLDIYGALILRRSLRFGQPALPCPSYDPETTGLLIYNELCLKQGAPFSGDILEALLRARLLSLLKYHGFRTTEDIIRDLELRANLIRGQGSFESKTSADVEKVLKELVQSEFIQLDESVEGIRKVFLTPKGRDLIDLQASTSERLADQFSASLKSRTNEYFPNDPESMELVSKAAESFLKECIDRRALGVAMATYHWRAQVKDYHMVALLQELPKFMTQLNTNEQAIALSRLVLAILSRPSDAERTYIGLAIQAQFGVHILGYDQATLQARSRDLSQTFFLVDSSTLIPFLAKSCVGHNPALLLINRLKNMNSILGTTLLLAEEVAEHARYAINKIEPVTGFLGKDTLNAATGRSGERSNAFLEGFLEEVSKGTISDFFNYLNKVCGSSKGTCRDIDIQRILKRESIICNNFDDWGGFDKELWHRRDTIQTSIADQRLARHTLKHERQVKAEAEALIIIDMFRNGKFMVNDQRMSNAYFISHTRAIDDVAGSGLPITMRPEFALQWVATIIPCTIGEISYLTNSLCWELSERDLTIVDKARLQVTFSPLIQASRERLEEEIERHRALISQRYGEDAINAFNETSSIDLPIVMDSYFVQKAEYLAKMLNKEQKMREKAQAQAKLTEQERQELERLRSEKKQKQKKALSKKRAAASRRKMR